LKKIAARDKAIAAAGAEILKALSKKPVEESKALVADQSAADDIAGSIALTIKNSGIPAGQVTTLLNPLASKGVLEKAFGKYAGKVGTADSLALFQAISDVRTGAAGIDAAFEDGNRNTAADLLNIFNDKETDKRNR
jgi:hypothetical protein